MGLFQAIDSAVSSILVSSKAFDIISNNIANANNENYIRRNIKTEAQIQEGIGSGVRISSLGSDVDEYALSNLRIQYSSIGDKDIIQKYLSQIDVLVGDPNLNNHLSSWLDKFYSSLNSLVSTPESSFARQNVVFAAKELSSYINKLSNNIQKIRFDVDTQISFTVDEINTSLAKLRELNITKNNFNPGSEGEASIDEDITNNLNYLASLININTYTDLNDNINITTSNGITLMDENNYTLRYQKATSLDVFLYNLELSPVEKYIISQNQDLGVKQILITGGKEREITSYLESGKLNGLQKLRDDILPQIIERLDNIAFNIAYQFNAVHNTGGSYSPRSEIVGKHLTSSVDARDWEGKVRIALVDENNKPIYYDSQKNRLLKPLDINLSTLDNGNGPGKALTVQDFIKEINEYFISASSKGRVRIGGYKGPESLYSGGIEDIKIVSHQNSITPGGNFSFEFEVDNSNSNNYDFRVLSLSVDNGGSVVTTQTNVFNSQAGNRERTGSSVGYNTVALNGGGGNYTITARVMVTDIITKEVSVSDLTYVINDNQSNVMNSRYTASSASGANTINGTLGAFYVPPVVGESYLMASLVDETGNSYLDSNTKAMLKLKSDKYKIVIDDKPIDINNNSKFYQSKETGLSSNPLVEASNKGWGHYYGLNNLFIENKSVRGSANIFDVRDDIKSYVGYELLSISGLRNIEPDTEQLATVGKVSSKLNVKLNNVPAIGDTITVNGAVFTFDNLGATNSTIDVSSANIATITQNIVNKLSADSSYNINNGVLLSTYTLDILNPQIININYNAKGNLGNDFTFAANFSGGATIEVNGSTPSSSYSGTLYGGQNINEKQSVRNFGFGLARGNKDITESMIKLGSKIIQFKATSNSLAVGLSISNYSNQNVMTYISNLLNVSDIQLKNEKITYDQFLAKYREGTGVNIDVELTQMVRYQATFNASSKIIGTISSLFENLIAAF